MLPASLIQSLLPLPGFNRERFEAVHQSGEQITSIRLNTQKCQFVSFDNATVSQVPWCAEGRYLSVRPSFINDPYWHAGAYYVQEASSMFLSQVVKQIRSKLPTRCRVLDLCAAPGGKSTLLLQAMGEESLLVSNEVIRTRVGILQENLTRWGLPGVIVTSNDPKDMGRLDHFFDVMVIDAPCSGSGLFRRDPDAIREWSPANVQLCSERQQRIIADAWNALRPGGYLIYSTCSYAEEENEQILDWIIQELQAETIAVEYEKEWGIVETVSAGTHAYGYRFYPDRVKGEGFFIACIRKSNTEISVASYHTRKPLFRPVAAAVEQQAALWYQAGAAIELREYNDIVFGFPSCHLADLEYLAARLFIKKAGVEIGAMALKEWIPHPALALSIWVSEDIQQIALNRQQAISYLKKETLQLDTPDKGWCMVNYEGLPLGWVKVLNNRINNYYPKEWRILK